MYLGLLLTSTIPAVSAAISPPLPTTIPISACEHDGHGGHDHVADYHPAYAAKYALFLFRVLRPVKYDDDVPLA